MSQVPELLRKFNISQQDLELVRVAGGLLSDKLEAFITRWYEWLRQQPEFDEFFTDPDNLQRVQDLQRVNWREFFRAEITDRYVASRQHIGVVHARIDLPNEVYFAGMSHSLELLMAELDKVEPEPAHLDRMRQALAKLLFLDTFLAVDTISRIAREKIAQHSKAMLDMATPVTPIWEGILLLPLVGIIDSMRTQDIMNRSLLKIGETRAKVFVLDISGVATVDTGVANQLIKITKATRLMGCESIISGISPAIARTVVELGVTVGEVKTTATLRDAFEIALKAVGDKTYVVDTGTRS